MTQNEIRKLSVGIFLIAGLQTGCTQFQTAMMNPGASSSSTNGSGNSTTTTPHMNAQVLATSVSQIFQNLSDSIPGFSSGFGALSCSSLSACSAGGAPSAQTLNFNCSGLTGLTTIGYSSEACSIFASNTISIAPVLQITDASSGLSYSASSASFTDYRGQNMGGGFSVSYSLLNGTASFAEPGMRYVSSASDIASRTVSPLSASLNISDMILSINGGALEVIDNLNHFVASVAANNLTFVSTCRCPVSGSANGSISGAFSGSVSLTFNSCGNIDVTALGSTQNVNVASCQP